MAIEMAVLWRGLLPWIISKMRVRIYRHQLSGKIYVCTLYRWKWLANSSNARQGARVRSLAVRISRVAVHKVVFP